jgi:hypothetical protein
MLLDLGRSYGHRHKHHGYYSDQRANSGAANHRASSPIVKLQGYLYLIWNFLFAPQEVG